MEGGDGCELLFSPGWLGLTGGTFSNEIADKIFIEPEPETY